MRRNPISGCAATRHIFSLAGLALNSPAILSSAIGMREGESKGHAETAPCAAREIHYNGRL